MPASGVSKVNKNCTFSGKNDLGDLFVVETTEINDSEKNNVDALAIAAKNSMSACQNVDVKTNHRDAFKLTAYCPQDTPPYITAYNYLGSSTELKNYPGSDKSAVLFMGFSKSPDHNIINNIIKNGTSIVK